MLVDLQFGVDKILKELGCEYVKTVTYDAIVFLDIDGVLNCQVFYEARLKHYGKHRYVESDLKLDYYKSNLSSDRIVLLNGLCKETNAVVVVSSTWRKGRTVEELQTMLDYAGATFKIIDITPSLAYERGSEIRAWLKHNIKPETHGMYYFDFHNYVILDDDSDMLLWQQQNFFQCDSYSGLTDNLIYKAKRFLNKQMLRDM